MIWKNYLFRQLVRLFLFLLFCLFLTYVLIDFSVHGIKLISHGKITGSAALFYYLQVFSRHFELFSSLSFLLSALKILLDLSAHHELVALQMAGLSRKRLLTPLFYFAMLLFCTCYCNSQWLAPEAQDHADAFRSTYFKHKKKERRENVYNIALDDDTELVYQRFDPARQELFDVFWIQSARDIWHMKYLDLSQSPPQGRLVDHLVRNTQGQFEKKESFPLSPFPRLLWNDQIQLHRFVPFENRSLSTLFRQAAARAADRESIATHLHYKLAMPLLPLLILIWISPIATRLSRTRPTFLILACSLFAFIGIITFMEAMLILGENRVLSPPIAIWMPIIILALLAFPSFSKMR